ncbi:toprim domain-containing protein [Nanoarchaeota archaeon]
MDNTKELQEWRKQLKASEKIIIVEGKNDKRALENIGIPKERIISLTKPLYAVAEDIAKHHRHAIILTDLDPEGKRIYMDLKRNLTRIGVQIDRKYREALFKLSKLSHIEGIDTFFNNIQK